MVTVNNIRIIWIEVYRINYKNLHLVSWLMIFFLDQEYESTYLWIFRNKDYWKDYENILELKKYTVITWEDPYNSIWEYSYNSVHIMGLPVQCLHQLCYDARV